MMRRVTMLLALVALLGVQGSAREKDEQPAPQFKYIGGTEEISEGCEGNLEINPEAVTFRCLGGVVDVPYSAITLMQYRSDISRKVRKMKLKWKTQPDLPSPILKAKNNSLFTVVYQANGATRAMVLRVAPRTMRPYLAELDLRSEKRVEVQTYNED